ncbi:MAG: hypothetical protein R3245_07540 [Kiloniellales bacterium]|nr:hypothetical protein [Kiloniellales bacterium]
MSLDRVNSSTGSAPDIYSIQLVPEPNSDSTWSVVAYWRGETPVKPGETAVGRRLLWKCEREVDARHALHSYWRELGYATRS